MSSTSGNWHQLGGSDGRGFTRGSNRTRSQFPQNDAFPKTYSNLHEIKVDHLKTDINNEGKEVEEFKKTFEDPIEDAVVDFSCHHDFTSRQLSLKIINVGKGSLEIISAKINCGKTPMECDWNWIEIEMRMDLSDRHVFDKNFNLTLKYSLNNAIFLESNYHFKVNLKISQHFENH